MFTKETPDELLQDYVASFPPILDIFDRPEERCDKVSRPDHYTAYEIEPIDYINMNKMGYNEGNVIKYISRHRMKNKAEDVRKAMKYCEFILRYEYGEDV